MYGIVVACVAVMAMFLALFAMSVEPESKSLEAHGLQDKLIVGSEHAGLKQGGVERR